MILLAACSEPVALHAPAQAKASVWSPGDPVPGWEDADCTFAIEGNVMEIEGMDSWSAIGTIDARTGLAGVAALALEMRDCDTFGCEVGVPVGWDEAHTSFSFSTEVDVGEPRGQGRYGPDDAVDRPVSASIYGVVGRGYNEDPPNRRTANVRAEACISRARPDMVSGVLHWQFFDSGRPIWFYWYPTMDFWSAFSLTFADHAGVELADSTVFAERGGEADIPFLPDEVRLGHWRYRGVSYDDAWPWAEITDDVVREEVYARYLPMSPP